MDIEREVRARAEERKEPGCLEAIGACLICGLLLGTVDWVLGAIGGDALRLWIWRGVAGIWLALWFWRRMGWRPWSHC